MMTGTEEGWEIQAHSLVSFSALPLGVGAARYAAKATTGDDLLMGAMGHEMMCTRTDIAGPAAKTLLPILGRLYTIVSYRIFVFVSIFPFPVLPIC